MTRLLKKNPLLRCVRFDPFNLDPGCACARPMLVYPANRTLLSRLQKKLIDAP